MNKILVLGDDYTGPSGCATQLKVAIDELRQDYKVVQMACADTNPLKGKIIDDDNGVRRYAVQGYGNPDVLNEVLSSEKPDLIFFITDPKYWIWLFDYSSHLKISIVYWHVWDSLPYPKFNRGYYLSCDHISCISRRTFDCVKNVAPEVSCSYLPHGVDPSVFSLQNREGHPDTRFLMNCRNMNRKKITDVMIAFSEVERELGKPMRLTIKSEIVGPSGTDLRRVKNDLCPGSNIQFIPGYGYTQADVVKLYGQSDVIVNSSDAEGFGLPVLEAMMTGMPSLASSTGGLLDQTTNNPGAIQMPVTRTFVGSPVTPYLIDEVVGIDGIKAGIRTMMQYTKPQLIDMGKLARKFCIDNGFTNSALGDKLKFDIETTLGTYKGKTLKSVTTV